MCVVFFMGLFMDYLDFISVKNLFQSWNEFKKGKRVRADVMLFEYNLEDNIFQLHNELKTKSYVHGGYSSFYVNDPKRRHIHKADVKDRIVHQILYDYLYQLFDKTFIYDSYSCRKEKGTHRAVIRLGNMCRKLSKNYTRDVWALKLDIKKFFASVDHQILKMFLLKKITDENIIWLLDQVIDSFSTDDGRGIPLGNLTSQIFSNIYLNQLDQFIKHELRVQYYLRYADDFVIISQTKKDFDKYTCILAEFLKENLSLELHPRKIRIRRLEWGIDFLGYIVLLHGVLLPRTKTKKRMLKNLEKKIKEFYIGEIDSRALYQSVNSYTGYLSHANTYRLLNQMHREFPVRIFRKVK